MRDRVPTKPNRVRIVPEDGSPAFYATMTRVDEPTQTGDPLNKSTFLKDDTAALFGLDVTAVPDDVFKKISSGFNMTGSHFIQGNEVIHTGNAEDFGIAKIASGSYVGTGKSGTNDKNTLNLSINAKVLVVTGNKNMLIASRGEDFALFFQHATGSANTPVYECVATWEGNSVQWYSTSTTIGNKIQMNLENIEYHYTAIG